jgi:alpha-L-fucosidase
VLGRDSPLDFTTRTGVLDSLTTDPLGEVSIAVPDSALDPLATVIALDFTDE